MFPRLWSNRFFVWCLCVSLVNVSAAPAYASTSNTPSARMERIATHAANTTHRPQAQAPEVAAVTQVDPESTPVAIEQDGDLFLPVLKRNARGVPTPTPDGPPVEREDSGWVSGVVYNSVTCNQFLNECQGLAGVRITLASVDTLKLAQVREARKNQAIASGNQPLAPMKDAGVTARVPGQLLTDNQGAFHFPVNDSGVYWIRAEKDGYTYAQRQVQIVTGLDTATDAIFLTPIDDETTNCTSTGCLHTSSDGSLQVEIPPGAIASGDSVPVSATNFKQVEFLPSGGLPEGTWETYAFNLGGASEYVFQPGTHAIVRIKNEKGFAPGTPIPLGYWNQATQAWEHAGTGRVSANGQWLEMEVSHFSNYDCNDPVTLSGLAAEVIDSISKIFTCGAAGAFGCFIPYRSGTLQEWIDLPAVQVLGGEVTPQLRYSTDRAYPTDVIDVGLRLPGATAVAPHVQWELFIEGQRTGAYTFDTTLDSTGEIGRYRYLWDGRNGRGEELPPGIYNYKVKLLVPYNGQYCYAQGGIFGNPPDCANGATGTFADATQELWSEGTVLHNPQLDSTLGAGWTLQGQQRLYRNDRGQILIADGDQLDEFLGLNLPVGYTEVAMMEELAAHSGSNTLALPLLVETAVDAEIAAPVLSISEEETPAGLDAGQAYAEVQMATATNVCGSLNADATWTTAGSPYVMTCDVRVGDEATLTIQPGVVVKGQQNTYLSVSGNLVNQGTAQQPVVFTSYFDDSHGGDTNGDGVATTPAPGDWKELELRVPVINVQHLIVAYSDEGLTFPSLGANTDITIQHNEFLYNNKQAAAINFNQGAGQVVAFDNSAAGNGVNGVLFSGNIGGSLTLDWQQEQALPLFINDSRLNVEAAGALILTAGTVLKGTTNGELTVEGRLVSLGTAEEPVIFTSLRDDSYGGDTNDDGALARPAAGDWNGIRIYSQIVNLNHLTVAYSREGLTFPNLGANVDIRVQNNEFLSNSEQAVSFRLNSAGGRIVASGNRASGNGVNGMDISGDVMGTLLLNWQGEPDVALVMKERSVNVNTGGALVMSPGTVFKGSPNTSLNVNGTLSVQGASVQPVVLTSFKDDNHGGDTNNDGGNSTPAGGDWDGIQLYSNSNHNSIRGCVVSYARRGIELETGDLLLERCILQNSSDTGLYINGDFDLRVRSNSFRDNSQYGIYRDGNGNIDALYNWWGDVSGPAHATLNPDGTGDTVGDGILFDPWSLSPDPYVLSQTATDHSRLAFEPDTETFVRTYLDGTQVYFNADGSHNYTLDPSGRKALYTYNENGSLATMGIVAPGESNPRWLWTFNYTSGKLSSITDRAGHTTNFVVDNQGNLVQATTPDNATQRFAYDERHLLTKHTDQKGAVTDYAYDDYGRIATVTEPERAVYNQATGKSETKREVLTFTSSDTGYDLINDSPQGDPDHLAPRAPTSAELVDRVAYGRGELRGHTNQWGAWLDETDGVGRTTTYERDANNNVSRLTYANGECVDFTYDANGNPLTESYLSAAACAGDSSTAAVDAGRTWSYTYEASFNQLKSVTDPLGQVTTFFYDYEEGLGEAGHLLRIEYPQVVDETGNAVTPKEFFTYNALGLLESETDLQGNVTKYLYTQGTPDEASGGNARFAAGVTPVPGLLTQVIENFGDSTHLNLTTIFKDFDAQGNAQTEIDPRGNITRYTYDALGRVLSMTDPLGQVTKNEYDNRGNPVRLITDYTTAPADGRNLVSEFAYDPDDRLLGWRVEADELVESENFAYDINGQLASYTDSEGQSTIYSYDAADQLTQITDPLGRKTTLAYTGRGQVASQTAADSSITAFTYNSFGDLNSLTPPGEEPHRLEYTLRNELALYRPPEIGGPTQTGYTYDALGQLIGETRPDGRNIAYNYDSHQRLRSMTFSRGQVLYNYHPSTNQMTGNSAPGGITLAYGYDKELLTSATWSGPVAGSVDYSYDNFYRLSALAVNDANSIAFQYDDSGFLTQAGALTINRQRQSRLPASSMLGTVNDQWGYDNFGKISSYQAKAGQTTLFAVDYTYDALDRIATRSETIGGATATYAYRYNEVGRLIEVKRNNSVVESYSYDANGNRAPGVYDEQDRLTQLGAVTYGYTANGDLLTKKQGNQTTTYNYDEMGNLMAVTLPTGKEIEYLVDGQDRRIGKRVDGALVQGFLYQDQLEPLAELDGAGNVVSRFVYGTQPHVPDYMIKGGKTYRIITDHLGSVRLVVNTQNGAVAQRIDYDAFGKVLQDSNPGFQPFAFAGGIYDRDTGLVRFGARDYDASVGRWTTKDPIGFEGESANLYTYVDNDPVNYIDPLGNGKVGLIIKISKAAWHHIFNRHVARNIFRHKSKFAKPAQIKKLAIKTVSCPTKVTVRSNGRKIYEKKFGRAIGTNGETVMRVVVDKFNNVITAFPTAVMTLGSLGHIIFGNNIFGEVVDFVNPFSDVKDVIELVQGVES